MAPRSVCMLICALVMAVSSRAFVIQSSFSPASYKTLARSSASLRMVTASPDSMRSRTTLRQPMNDVIPTRRASSSVKLIMGTADFNSELEKAAAEGDILVVKYFAGFCRACKKIEGAYNNLATEMEGSNLRFVEVKFEDNKELCRKNGIKSLPHVQVFADKKALADMSVTPSKFDTFTAYLSEHMGNSNTFSADPVIA